MSPALVKAAIDTLAAKASNVLSLETKQKFYGMTESNTPDDVFRFFGKYNLYYWKRRLATKSIKQTLQNLIYDGYYNNAFYVFYADVAPTNTSDFNNTSLTWGATPTIVGGSATYGGANILNNNVKGKYWGWRSGSSAEAECKYYSLSNANFTNSTNDTNTKIYGTNTYILTVEIAYGAWELVTSLQSDAYPSSGFGDVVQVSGGYQAYEYEALGRPLDKLDITL